VDGACSKTGWLLGFHIGWHLFNTKIVIFFAFSILKYLS